MDAVGAVDVGIRRAGRTSRHCARCGQCRNAPPDRCGDRPRPRRSCRRRRRPAASRRSARARRRAPSGRRKSGGGEGSRHAEEMFSTLEPALYPQCCFDFNPTTEYSPSVRSPRGALMRRDAGGRSDAAPAGHYEAPPPASWLTSGRSGSPEAHGRLRPLIPESAARRHNENVRNGAPRERPAFARYPTPQGI